MFGKIAQDFERVERRVLLTWLECTVERTAAETIALELESPELGGMLPQTAAKIPRGTHSLGITSRAPFTPQRKYLYQSGPRLVISTQTLHRKSQIYLSLSAPTASSLSNLHIFFFHSFQTRKTTEDGRIGSMTIG